MLYARMLIRCLNVHISVRDIHVHAHAGLLSSCVCFFLALEPLLTSETDRNYVNSEDSDETERKVRTVAEVTV